MSSYTTQLRYLLEMYAGVDGSLHGSIKTVDDVIGKGRRLLFGSYPIFNEDYRGTLESKICRHYYTSEIGYETPEAFRLALYTKMNEIMPYYNKLYESELLSFDPFQNKDITTCTASDESHESNRMSSETINASGEDSRENNETVHTLSRSSDTPHSALIGVEDNRYLTQAAVTDAKTSGNQSGDYMDYSQRIGNHDDNESEHVESWNTVQGKDSSESYSDLLIRFRETFLNIDMLIIKELEPLFFGLWPLNDFD